MGALQGEILEMYFKKKNRQTNEKNSSEVFLNKQNHSQLFILSKFQALTSNNEKKTLLVILAKESVLFALKVGLKKLPFLLFLNL